MTIHSVATINPGSRRVPPLGGFNTTVLRINAPLTHTVIWRLCISVPGLRAGRTLCPILPPDRSHITLKRTSSSFNSPLLPRLVTLSVRLAGWPGLSVSSVTARHGLCSFARAQPPPPPTTTSSQLPRPSSGLSHPSLSALLVLRLVH